MLPSRFPGTWQKFAKLSREIREASRCQCHNCQNLIDEITTQRFDFEGIVAPMSIAGICSGGNGGRKLQKSDVRIEPPQYQEPMTWSTLPTAKKLQTLEIELHMRTSMF